MNDVKKLNYCTLCLLILGLWLLTACSQQPTTSISTEKTTLPSGSAKATNSLTSSGKITKSGEPFYAIRFVDQHHGWALTNNKVMSSQDGGKTWSDVTKHSMLDGGQNAQAVFQTADRAWVFVTERKSGATNPGITMHVWRTINGGKDWQASTFDDNDAIEIADRPNFAGSNNGWILLGTGAGAGSYGVHLYQTKDSGVSWKQIAAAPGKLPLSGSKSGPSFSDEKEGWIANHVGAMTDSPLLYRSFDGGTSWYGETLPLLPSLTNADYRTTPPLFFGSVVLVPAHVSSGTGAHLVMYISGNYGGRWYVSNPAAFDTDNLYVIDQQDAVALDRGTVYTTKDTGWHWSKAGSLPPTADAMSFISPREGWSLDSKKAALYHTINGGTSWETINYNFAS